MNEKKMETNNYLFNVLTKVEFFLSKENQLINLRIIKMGNPKINRGTIEE